MRSRDCRGKARRSIAGNRFPESPTLHPKAGPERIALEYQPLGVEIMPLFALGLNHATAPVSVRERVAFQLDTLGQALRDLLGQPLVREAAILSTCNRTEVYF